MVRERLTAAVQKALGLLPVTHVAEGTGKGYRTLQAYLYGDRTPTPEAAREIAAYLRSRSVEFAEIAEELEAVSDEEES